MNPPTTFRERLKTAMTHASKTHEQLAKSLGKARSAVTHWHTGRNEPDREDVARIAEALGVRCAWLAFDDGPMLAPSSVERPDIEASSLPDGPRVVRDSYSQVEG